MQSLIEVVNQYFPEERVLNSSKVKLSDSWNNFGSRAKYWYLSPLDMVETSHKYYFDRRQPYLKAAKLSLFAAPLWLGGFAFFLWLLVWNRTPESFFIVTTAFILGLLVSVGNQRINQGLVNIVILKKDWIRTNKTEKDHKILSGEIPKGENYSLIYSLSTEQQSKLSFLDKFFSGVALKKLNKFSPITEFTFSYNEVK